MNVTHYIGFDVHKKHINFCRSFGVNVPSVP